jgi:hypothetical protein
VVDHVVEVNPAHAVRFAGRLARSRAHRLGVMVYTFARVGSVLQMNVSDYFSQGRRGWVRLHEKGGKGIPKLEAYLDEQRRSGGRRRRRGRPALAHDRTRDRQAARHDAAWVERQMQTLFLAPTAYPARLARYESQLEDPGRDLVEVSVLAVRPRPITPRE